MRIRANPKVVTFYRDFKEQKAKISRLEMPKMKDPILEIPQKYSSPTNTMEMPSLLEEKCHELTKNTTRIIRL